MIGPDFLPHTITAYPAVTTIDQRGNELLAPATVGVELRAWMQPFGRDSSSEDLTQGQANASGWVAYLEPSAPFMDAHSRVTWLGRTFESTREAQVQPARDGIHHQRLLLRHTGGA